MSEKVLFKDGLLIDQKVLEEVQNRAAKNLVDRMGLVLTSPGVFATVGSTGAITSGDLLVVGGPIGPNTFYVLAGKGLTTNYDLINVAANTAEVAIPNDSTFRKVIATYASSSLETGTLAATTGSNTWTGTGTAFTSILSPGAYFRVSGSAAGNNATYQVLAVASNTSLTTTSNALGTTESALTFSQAGKFFPGYPLSGNTDIDAFNSYTISLQSLAYTPTGDDIYLADVKNASGAVTITDRRVAIVPIIKGLQIVDANVRGTAAIAESKIALSADTIAAKTQRHAQNTDTYTTAATFKVGGSNGPRVLTEADINRTVGATGGSTMPTVLATEVNLVTSFVNASVSGALPQLKAQWGVAGTGTYSAGVVTVTSHNNAVSTIAVDGLTNFVLVDSTGQLYKITGSAQVTTTGATPFTVNVVVDTGASQPNPTDGAVKIRAYATNYTLRITPVENDNVTYLVGNRKSYVAEVDSSGTVLTSVTTGTSIAGKLHKIELVASNASLTPTSTTVTQTKTWGAAATGTVVNVPGSSISISATANTVTFDWPAPAGFDGVTMDYRAAHTINGTTPSVFVDVPNESAVGGGSITFAANPGVQVKILVRVIDMSGNTLSTSDGAAGGYPSQLTPQTFAIPVKFSFSGLHTTTTSSFTDPGDGTSCKILGTHVSLRSMQVVGMALVLDSLTGSSPSLKIRSWPKGFPQNGVSGNPETTAVSNPYDTRSGNLGNALVLALEAVSGTITDATGTGTVYYQEIPEA